MEHKRDIPHICSKRLYTFIFFIFLFQFIGGYTTSVVCTLPINHTSSGQWDWNLGPLRWSTQCPTIGVSILDKWLESCLGEFCFYFLWYYGDINHIICSFTFFFFLYPLTEIERKVYLYISSKSCFSLCRVCQDIQVE